jgi:hypothetical protein
MARILRAMRQRLILGDVLTDYILLMLTKFCVHAFPSCSSDELTAARRFLTNGTDYCRTAF